MAQTPLSTSTYPFLAGGGEMGELIRQYDWSKTPLGTPDAWPYSLRTSVSNMLHTGLPMLVLWGPELICLYNDPVIPSLDPATQHPAIGRPCAQLWSQAWPVIGPLLEGVRSTGEPVTFQDVPMLFYRHGQTQEVFWTFCYSAILTEDGRIGGILATCLETTQGVLARRQLEKSQQVLALFEEAPVAIAIISADDTLLFRTANAFYASLVGRRADELVGRPLLKALPELTGQGFEALLKGVIQSGKPHIARETGIELLRNGKLETVYVDVTYQPRLDPDNQVVDLLIIAIDMTEQVVARRQVEESEARFRSLIRDAPVAMLVYEGPDQVLVEANQKMLAIFGRDDTILGKPVLEAVPELRDSVLPGYYRQVLATGEPYHHPAERILLIKNGEPYWGYYNYIYKPLYTEQRTIYGVICTAIDVTDQVRAQQALEEREATLQSIIDLAELGSYSIDVVTGQLNKSARVAQWYGLPPTTDVATSFGVVAQADRERVSQVLTDALKGEGGGFYQVEYTIMPPTDGLPRVLRTIGQVKWDAVGQPIRVDGTVLDITAQRQRQLALEQQVQQRTHQLQVSVDDLQRSNQNLEQFAYVASHDLQEPLRKIQQFGALLLTQYGPELGEGVTYLERMQLAAARMSTLIRDLLSYSRIATRQETASPVALNEVVGSVLIDLEVPIQETGAVIEVDSLPTVLGNASQLGQLFQNLLSNALKFRQAHVPPLIQVRMQLVAATALPATVRPVRPAKAYHRIEVTDNGIGFDDKHVDRIFAVFQRLHGKDQYSGSGVGLAICEKVAANHGGAITARSQPGQGAVFSVYLPV